MEPLTPDDVDARFAEIIARERGVGRRVRSYLVGRAIGATVLALVTVGALIRVVGVFLAAWKYLLGG
ncbi:hypothetical protein [uncultured Leifsonia sp.]|uniref:hypothetical protein n=1 Tax=uncultured Leifsonia sp. TaxID=340359 RepID=UPI0025E74F15|nr:hypothetical protein [uncultured Leifsonia sp.]